MNRARGFSIVELMVVVTIIGCLASIASLNYRFMMMKSRIRRAEGEISAVRLSLEAIRANHTVYPHCTPQSWLSIEPGKIHYMPLAGCNGASADVENTAGLGDFYSLFANLVPDELFPNPAQQLAGSPCGSVSAVPIAYIFNIGITQYKIVAECFPGTEYSQLIDPSGNCPYLGSLVFGPWAGPVGDRFRPLGPLIDKRDKGPQAPALQDSITIGGTLPIRLILLIALLASLKAFADGPGLVSPHICAAVLSKDTSPLMRNQRDLEALGIDAQAAFLALRNPFVPIPDLAKFKTYYLNYVAAMKHISSQLFAMGLLPPNLKKSSASNTRSSCLASRGIVHIMAFILFGRWRTLIPGFLRSIHSIWTQCCTEEEV